MSELVYVFVMNYSKEVLCFVNETVQFKKKTLLKTELSWTMTSLCFLSCVTAEFNSFLYLITFIELTIDLINDT